MDMMLQVLCAAVGSVAFALLFGVPKKYCLYCGISGGIGWLFYLLLANYCGAGNTMATLGGAIVMTLTSRILAVAARTPVTVFITSGIIPLVPGARVFWMAYYTVIGDNAQALNNGMAALKAAGAIVLAMVLVFELPGKLFRIFERGK